MFKRRVPKLQFNKCKRCGNRSLSIKKNESILISLLIGTYVANNAYSIGDNYTADCLQHIDINYCSYRIHIYQHRHQWILVESFSEWQQYLLALWLSAVSAFPPATTDMLITYLTTSLSHNTLTNAIIQIKYTENR